MVVNAIHLLASVVLRTGLMLRKSLPLLLALVALPLGAHDGEVHRPFSTWTFDPLVLTLLATSAILYGRGALGIRALRGWQVAAFYAGLAAIFVAQISPLDHASDILFSAHMGQHELIVLIAAPLIVFGQPLAPMLKGLPAALRDNVVSLMRRPGPVRLSQWLSNPLYVTVLHAVVLIGWHFPLFYEAAIRNEAVHFLQHAMFLSTAVLFWWGLAHGKFGRMGYGIAVLFVFATTMYSGALGAMITFAPRVWYPIYEARSRAVNVDPLADQQLAGLIMWVPAGALLVVVGVALFAAWLGNMERRSPSLPEEP